MNKYLRNANFKWLSLSLLVELVISFVFVALLLAFAKHYADHKAPLIAVGLILAGIHGVTMFFSIWGLLTVTKHTSVTLQHSYQKSVYWNSIVCGFLFYPVFFAWYAYRHSGFTQTQINDFTKAYIYKHFDLVKEIATVTDKLDNNFKQEHENVKELVKDKKLTALEGNKYLFDYLFEKGIINDSLLTEVQKNHLEKIIEEAN